MGGGNGDGAAMQAGWVVWLWANAVYVGLGLLLSVLAWFCPDRLPLAAAYSKLLVLLSWLTAEGLLVGVWFTRRNGNWRWPPFLLGAGTVIVTPVLCLAIALPYVIWLLEAPAPPQLANTAGVRVLASEPEGFRAVSQPLTFVGDNQTHYLGGKSFRLQSTQIDQFSGAAIRPVVLNLFSRPLVEWSLTHVVRDVGGAVIHLGDALDISCHQEFREFRKIVKHALTNRKWALTPGNHDGYFFGNFDDDNVVAGWGDACAAVATPGAPAATPVGPMDKREFIRGYVRLLRETHAQVPACVNNGQGEETVCRGFYRRMYWKLDDDEMRRSFIVQELDISARQPTSLVLLDTAAYYDGLILPKPDHLVPVAGARGEILAAQFELVRKWIRASPKRRFLLAGHHNFEQLTTSSKKRLRSLLREPNVYQAFVSAHSHNGRYEVQDGGRYGDWLELNVGSLLDWPQEWLELQIGRANGAPVLRSTRTQLRNLWAKHGRQYDVEPPACRRSKDYGSAYVALNAASVGSARSYLLIAQNIAQAYERFVSDHPDTPNAVKTVVRDVNRELSAVAARTSSPDPETLAVVRRHLARLPNVMDLLRRVPEARDDVLCQAYWASRYDEAAVPSDTRSPWLQLPGQDSTADKERR